MIRIAYIIHSPWLGGAELHLLEVIAHLDRCRFDPLLIFLVDARRKPLYERFRATGVDIVNLDLPQGMLNVQTARKLWQLSRTLRIRRIDIVHGYLWEGNLVAALVGVLAGIKTRIISKRSLEQHGRKQLAVARLSNRLASHITAVSGAVGRFVREAEGAAAEKIVVIPNGVRLGTGLIDPAEMARLRSLFQIPAESVLVGTVARFNWKKGYQYFIEAAAQVVRKVPTIRFVAFGDGPLKAEMDHLVEQLGLERHVFFVGWESDARSKLGLFDIYVCASVIEGMSNAILEAMAEQRPVIATAVGGNPETIRHGETGYLVRVADPADLAERILTLAKDSALRRRVGEAAREAVAQDFTLERMVEQMQDFYTSLAAAR